MSASDSVILVPLVLVLSFSHDLRALRTYKSHYRYGDSYHGKVTHLIGNGAKIEFLERIPLDSKNISLS